MLLQGARSVRANRAGASFGRRTGRDAGILWPSRGSNVTASGVSWPAGPSGQGGTRRKADVCRPEVPKGVCDDLGCGGLVPRVGCAASDRERGRGALTRARRFPSRPSGGGGCSSDVRCATGQAHRATRSAARRQGGYPCSASAAAGVPFRQLPDGPASGAVSTFQLRLVLGGAARGAAAGGDEQRHPRSVLHTITSR